MRFKLSFKETNQRFSVDFKNENILFDLKFKNYQETGISEDVEYYTDQYEITPSAEEQKLYTKQKYMLNDVTVNEIPFFETKNEMDGITVYIGTEIEFY